jgi:adenylylsulfate kinase
MVIWITGKGHAGKTTTARKLATVIPKAVLLDSYDFRRYFPGGDDFSDRGRRNNIMRLARVAAILEQQGFVPIVACVSPTKELRNEARRLFKESMVIYVPGGQLWEGTTYEEPDIEEIKGIIAEPE